MTGLAIFLNIIVAYIWVSPKGFGRWLAEVRNEYDRNREFEDDE